MDGTWTYDLTTGDLTISTIDGTMTMSVVGLNPDLIVLGLDQILQRNLP